MASQGAAGARKNIRAADYCQPADPHQRRGHDVVVGAEVVVGAREHPVGAGAKILRRLDVVGVVAEVVRGGEVDGESLEGLRGDELGPITVIEPLPLRLAGAEAGEPIGLQNPEVDLGEIFVSNTDRRPGSGPRALGEHFERLPIDLGDEIFAELAASRLGMRSRASGGDRPGLHYRVVVVHLAHDARQPVADQRRDFVLAAVFEQGFECLGRSGVAIVVAAGGERGGAGPIDPVEIGGQQRRAIGVAGVGLEESAEEPHFSEERRVGVGRGLLRPPGEKRLPRAEGGRIDLKLKQILRIGKPPHARRSEAEGVVGDDIPHRRPPGIGHRAFVEELIPLAHRQRLEAFGWIERGGKPAADLGDHARQIPGSNSREPLDRLPFFVDAAAGPACPLRKAPLIVLEKSPRPVGEDRLEDRLDLVGGFLKRRFEADEPLGIFRGAVAGVGLDARGDRPRRFVPGLRGDRALLDPGEGLEGRFWFPFVERPLHRHPLPFAGPVRSGGLGGAARRIHDQGPAEKHKKPGKDRGDT